MIWRSTSARRCFGWLQGYLLNHVVQRTVCGCARDVEAKLIRLPLAYFDAQPHGELLSRVTNDIDNVATSLQQTLSQILTSLLTVVGVLVMMVVISPLLALIALVTVPLSLVVTAQIGKRAQKRFVAQWKHVGALNGQIEEAFTGHALVKVFGRRARSRRASAAKNDELFDASFRAQFISEHHHAGDRRSSGTSTTSRSRSSAACASRRARCCSAACRRSSSTRASSRSSSASSRRWPTCCSPASRRPSACSSCSTRPTSRRTRRRRAARRRVRGEVAFEDVAFRYKPDEPLIERPLARRRARARPSRSSARPARARRRWSTCSCGSTSSTAAAIPLDGVDIATLPRAELRARARHGAARHLAVRRHDPRQHRVRQPGGDRGARSLAAAKATYVDRFVRALPDGYDTVIDEESSNLSAGEKQLITIARAFLADPSILILDEATRRSTRAPRCWSSARWRRCASAARAS